MTLTLALTVNLSAWVALIYCGLMAQSQTTVRGGSKPETAVRVKTLCTHNPGHNPSDNPKPHPGVAHGGDDAPCRRGLSLTLTLIWEIMHLTA